MDCSEIIIYKKKSDESNTTTGTEIEKNNINKKYSSNHDTESLKVGKASSFPYLIFQNKAQLYIPFNKNKIIINKFFLGKNKEKIDQTNILFGLDNLFINNNLSYSKQKQCQVCKGYKIVDNNKKVNNYVNNSTHISNMSTNDSLSLLTCKNKIIYVNFAFSKKNYCNYIPKRNEMNNKPSQKPNFFPEEIFLGIYQSQLENDNNKYLIRKDYFFCSENNTYKKIDPIPHFLLKHLFQGKNNNISANIRYRHKNVLFVYYK